MPPQALINGRYELKDTLGQGGMGVVYRAYDNTTRRDVAIKTMHDSANAMAVELFAKEWSVLANISHPNIVDILDCGEFGSKGQRRPFFVMPLLPGRTLDQLIHGAGERLTIGRTVEVLRQTCRGLQAAHERGLVHRDLKPSNIFVMQDDAVKIIDFGVVHLTGSQSITGLKGTVQYMAPEQLDLKPATTQSDIFSLGVVAYEALTSRKPFARKGEVETAEAVRLHIPPPASEINPAVGDQVSRVIHKAMAKQPWHRFSSAREFGDMLEKAQRGEIAFDISKIRPRIERATKAFNEGDLQFASDILNELEAEGNSNTEMNALRLKIDQAGQQRRVRQLLESGRARLEQEEYPLALQKVQEVLRLDPDNAEALGMRHEIESQRGERQVENWLRLARENLDRGAFSEARQGLEEGLKINSNDPRLHQLLNDLTRQEQENSKARQQKELLYQEARHAFQNGEISTALSKLERVLELNRRVPDRTSPERDALYQGFYNQVRSESDASRIAYEDARRYLNEKDFPKALAVCEESLKKNSGLAIFQALKLEIGERERQELYSFITETERRLDAEPDLDRKLAIAKEAADRYPQEAQFKQSLKLVRDRRDLVIGIVAKSRQYEERRQFAEAIGQWEILRGIYPQYPGLAFELEQLKRRRDQQSREEAKSRWVEQTDLALTSGDFERALDLAQKALAEFPEDAELVGLARLATQSIGRRHEAQLLLEKGQQLCAANQFDEGLAALKQAVAFDPHNPTVRSALVNSLVQHAQELSNHDWTAAEPLIQQVLELDANNLVAKSIRSQIQDHRRRQVIDRCLAEARDLRAAGNYKSAFEKVDSVLKTYPSEQRLLQFKASLQKEESEAGLRKQRDQDLGEMRQLSAEAEQAQEVDAFDSIFARSVVISEKYPGDIAFTALARALEGRATMVRDGSQNGQPLTGSTAEGPSAPSPPLSPLPAKRSAAASSIFFKSWLDSLPNEFAGLASNRNVFLKWAAIAAVPLLLFAASIYTISHRNSVPIEIPPPPPRQSAYPVSLNITPANALVRIDGAAVSSRSPRLPAGSRVLEVSLPGYRTVSQPVLVRSQVPPVSIALVPELLHLRIVTAFPTGKVLLDGKEVGLLEAGQFSKEDISLAEHTVQVVDAGRDLLNIHLVAAAARAPRLLSPARNKLVAVGTFDTSGNVYSDATLQVQNPRDGGSQPIPAEGLAVSASNGGGLTITDGKRAQLYPLEFTNYPLLELYTSGEIEAQPLLSITASVPDPNIFVDGKPVAWRPYRGKIRGRLAPGTYQISLSKPGYEDTHSTVILAKGDRKVLDFQLKPLAVKASLLIEGGTPGTEILIDEVSEGQLDVSGKLLLDQLIPGTHEIGVRKENYEARKYTRTFIAGQALRLSAGDAKLTPFGTIEFHILTPEATVEYKRSGESEFHQASNSQPIPLPQGAYTVRVFADGFETKEGQFNIAAGANSSLSWSLKAKETKAPEPRRNLELVESQTHWYLGNGWILYQGPSYGWMRSAQGSYTVDIRKREGKFLGLGSGIDFVVGYNETTKNRVAYHIGKEGRLVRRTTVDGRTQESTSTFRLIGDETYRLLIEIEPGRVVVRDRAGKGVDDSQPLAFNVADGKFGFKSGLFIHITRQ